MTTALDLKEKYTNEIIPELMKQYQYKNVMEVPRLLKVSLNRGVGEAIENPKAMEVSLDELTRISGQKASVRKSKKSIATFKLRENQPIGVKVTLHGKRMMLFLNKLINICLPKIRDFKGLSPKLDGNGNYTMGIKEQIIFPEIHYEKVDKVRGMDITIVTSAKTDDEARTLLTLLGMPFRK